MTLLACLPMYDWPEVQGAWDGFWHGVRRELRQQGIAAPEALDRTLDERASWTSPDLLLGQTCGLPYVRRLTGRAHVLGSLAFALEDCPPGDYRSRIVVRNDSPVREWGDLRGARLAVNSRDSQSGYNALIGLVRDRHGGGAFFSEEVETGSHRASIRAVAAGTADLAAIDAVTWCLALDHERASNGLRVLTSTAVVPGLPLITAFNQWKAPLAKALALAVERMPSDQRRALSLTGFTPKTPEDYRRIRDLRVFS